MLKEFLEDEVMYQEFYDGIFDFIVSGNIRNGEYEGNLHVIKKMDLENFIIYVEHEIDGKREIHRTTSIRKKKLLRLINHHAKKQKFVLREYNG